MNWRRGEVMNFVRMFFLGLLLVAAGGCAHPISGESMKLVDPDLEYAQMREHPDDYRGKYLLAGGIIARIANSRTGGELEILQFQVDGSGYPDTAAAPGGRFLARTETFLDPLVFRPGLPTTLVGEVAGEERRELDGVDYRYPVLKVRELHVWKPGEKTQPVFHFGLGIGTVF
jgi:outer membrane lipoprotein